MTDNNDFLGLNQPEEPEGAERTVAIGDEVDLAEIDQTMHKLRFGMGWNFNPFDHDPPDLDMSLFLLNKDGQTRVDEDFVFYNNAMALDGAIKHRGDSRTGAGEGDDEQISLDLHGVPFDVTTMIITLSIYQGIDKDHNLGMVKNTFLRIVNESNDREVVRFNLTEELRERPETGMIMGFMERIGPRWTFKPAAQFHQTGLKAIAEERGMIIIDQ